MDCHRSTHRVLEFVVPGKSLPISFTTSGGAVNAELANFETLVHCAASHGEGEITGTRTAVSSYVFTGAKRRTASIPDRSPPAHTATFVADNGRMGMRRRAGVLSFVLGAFAGAAPALGAPALTPSSIVSPLRERVSEPTVAVSAEGRMLAAWDAVRGELEPDRYPSCGSTGTYGLVEARLGAVAHGWHGVQVLGVDGVGPVAAVGANGTAAVAWCSLAKPNVQSLYVSIARPGRPFGRAMRVPIDCFVPEGLKVQPDGRVVVICSKTLEYVLTPLKTRIEFALLSPHGGQPVIGPIATSSPGAGVSMAETEAGDVLVAFPPLAPQGVKYPQDVSQLTPAARAFAAAQAIEPSKAAFIRAAKVVAGPGGAALDFDASQEENEEDGMAEQLPDGMFGPSAPTIPLPSQSTGGQFTHEYGGPDIAFPAGGERVAIWDSILRLPAPPGPGEEGAVQSVTILAAVRPAGAGDFQAPVQLSVGPGLSGPPKITTAGGTTLALWVQDEPHCRQRVYAATGALGTAAAQVRAVSDSYTPAKGECGEGNGQLVLAGSGPNAIAGWMQGSALHIATETAATP